jgi:hypothetical protein
MVKIIKAFAVIVVIALIGFGAIYLQGRYAEHQKEAEAEAAKLSELKGEPSKVDKDFRYIDWDDGKGHRLKMKIPNAYIADFYERDKHSGYKQDITLRYIDPISFSESGQQIALNKHSVKSVINIELYEKYIAADVNANKLKSIQWRIKDNQMYAYPNSHGLNHFKPIICSEEQYPHTMKKANIAGDVIRDELTPDNCWVFGTEEYIPKDNKYRVTYGCTPIEVRSDGAGMCRVFAHFHGWKVKYAIARYRMPYWKQINEDVLAFLEQFIITKSKLSQFSN